MNDSANQPSAAPPSSPAPGRWQRFIAWRERKVPTGVTIMTVATIIGVGAGVGAWFLKWSIGSMASFFLGFESPDGINWYILALPIIGIMMAVGYQQWIVKSSLEHGTFIIRDQLLSSNFNIRPGLCYEPLIASMLTLGFGGSAGAEGPIATSGAAIGSRVARIFGLSPEMVRIMIGCGAGAGIAGIFKAPIGGALFTLEVMKMKMTTMTTLALIVSSIAGALTCYALTGFTFDVQFLPTGFFDPTSLGWVSLLGLVCGVYSVYYNRVTDMIHRGLKRMANPWVRALASSALVALIIFLFPAMYGEGYGIVTQLVNGHTHNFLAGSPFMLCHDADHELLLFGAAILMLKVFATIATNSGGGVAGDFAPTIFAGAFCGLVFAWGMNELFDAKLDVGLFALFGTAGAFAGIIHAPLMATFLVAEMVGNGYGYFLPLAFVAAISYITVKVLTPFSTWHAGDHHDDLWSLLHFHSSSKTAAKPTDNKKGNS